MGNSGVVQANSGPTGYEYVVRAGDDDIQPVADVSMLDGRTGRVGKELAGDRVTRAGTAYLLGKKPIVFSTKASCPCFRLSATTATAEGRANDSGGVVVV